MKISALNHFSGTLVNIGGFCEGQIEDVTNSFRIKLPWTILHEKCKFRFQ